MCARPGQPALSISWASGQNDPRWLGGGLLRASGARVTGLLPLVLHPRQRGCLRVRALAVGPSGRCRPGRRLLLLSVLRWGRAPLVPEEEGQGGDDGADP